MGGKGSCLNDIARQLGAALGVSFLGSFFRGHNSSSMRIVVEGLPSELAGIALNSIGGASRVATLLGGTFGQRLLDVSFGAFVGAFRVTALVAALVAAIALFVIARRNLDP